ncbi:hypothetical protein [Pseudomonas monsensis]|uniref:hypothetical protein n=1 Tax=Pseudomonas monsensis TaxID=2745509 RepID=UPI003D1C8266
MFKATPNPPETDSIPYDATLEAENIKTPAERAINHYLDPGAQKTFKPPRKPGKIHQVNPIMDDETLLVEACETLLSASDMARDIGAATDSSALFSSNKPYAVMIHFGEEKSEFPHLCGEIPSRPFLPMDAEDIISMKRSKRSFSWLCIICKKHARL